MNLKTIGLVGFAFAVAVFIGSLALSNGWFQLEGVSVDQAGLGVILGFFGVFIAPIFVFAYVALRDANKSFKSQKPGSITFRDWLYNLIPFRPINKLIKQVFPEDQIVSKKVGLEAVLFPVPIFIVETNNNYFIDRRLQNFINPILIGLFLYLFGPVLLGKLSGVKDVSIVEFVIAMIIILMVPVTLFHLFWQVNNIEVIKKSWLTAIPNTGHLLFLYGKSKIARLSLSTDKFVNQEGEISLPFKKTFWVF